MKILNELGNLREENKQMISALKRWTALTLVLAILSQTAVPLLAQAKDATITLKDADGNTQTVDKSWEETYPYGTFAFSKTQINLKEGAKGNSGKGELILYRLGGTEGRAEAYVTLAPAAVQLDDGEISYANAAGTQDYKVSVEDPQPIAKYQALGSKTAGWQASNVAPKADPKRSTENTEAENGKITYGEQCYILPDIKADSYRWQVQAGEDAEWKDITKATKKELVVSNEQVFSEETRYDFRCIYVIDNQTYCSESLSGQVFSDDGEEDEVPEMPGDFVNDTTPTYSDIEMEDGEYDEYNFLVVFADGESQKTIRFEQLDDDLNEAAEIAAITIAEARGATLYDTAKTATVAIEDDEPELPSAMGFAETEVWADKAEGKVRIRLERETEAPQYITGADYTAKDGTAVTGRDFALAEGSAMFASDLLFTYIEIDLVDDGVALSKEESKLEFTVDLTKAKGGGKDSSLIEGKKTVTVHLWNSGTGDGTTNLPSQLYSAEEIDLTGKVNETKSILPQGSGITAKEEEKEEAASGIYSVTLPGAFVVFSRRIIPFQSEASAV